MRMNCFCKLLRDKGSVGMDDVVEQLNSHSEEITTSKNLENHSNKSIFMNLMQRFRNDEASSFENLESTNSSVQPKRKRERHDLMDLFTCLRLFDSLDRKIDNNWMWKYYTRYKLQKEEDKATEHNAHELNVD